MSIEKYTKDLSPERRALLELLLKEKSQAQAQEKKSAEAPKRPSRNAIPRREAGVPAVLSLAQERLWFLDQLNPGNPAYSVPAVVRLSGRLDVATLTRALGEVMRRHETLRTSFAAGQGRPAQVIDPSFSTSLPLIDLAWLPDSARHGRIEEIAAACTRAAFDLGRGPLFRMVLLRLSGQEHVAVLAIHHIISDQWSINILVQELGLLYGAFLAGRPSPLPEPEIQYADFAAWQRDWLRRTSLEKDIEFWKGALAGAPGALDLPTDRPRPPVQSFWGAKQFIAFPAALTADVKSLARREGASLFMLLLAGLYTLLFRTTSQDDIVVGTPVANRNRPELEGVIGPLLNTLLLRGDLAGNPTFRELLARVRDMTVEAFQHQDLPFEKLLEELQPERTMSRNPLFQVTFVLQTAPRGELRAPGLIFAPLDIDAGTVQLDLTLQLVETPQGLSGWLEYDTDLFHAPTIDRQIGHLRNLLEGVARDPGLRLRELPLLAPAELHQVVSGWNDTDAGYERELTMHRLFERQVERTPDALAAEMGEDRLTYAELNHRANQLAHLLIGMGIDHGRPVGLHLGRGLHDLVALLGILKAGGAYVPIDVGQPLARIDAIVRTAGIDTLVTEGVRSETVHGLAGALRQVVWMDEAAPAEEMPGIRSWRPSDAASRPTTDPAPRVDSETLAYVIFTSGSTGTPKGVMVRHRPVINLIEWVNRTFEVGPGDRVLFITALSFDLSVYDVFGILAAGGTIRMASEAELREPEALVRILVEEPITFWDSAPAALQQLVPFLPPAPVAGSRLRLVFQSGDWIPVTLPDRVRTAFPGARVISLGGATEATVWSNWFPVREVPRWWVSIPYGRPIQNARYYVLDAELRPLPAGAPGDLYIGGECLSSGYLGRPDGTADQYMPDPFHEEPGTRFYRTGDQARFWGDGTLEFLGRRDHQVKIRGYRIELGEIQAALTQHPEVREAAVLAVDAAGGDKRLVAWFAPRGEGGEAPAASSLRAWLQTRLPEYMIPPVFVAVEALPVTSNGKLDRKALPAPEDARAGSADAGAAPRNPTEEVLVSIWAEVLEIERVGVFDNLFELGAHSLLATQVVSRIRESLGVELPLRTLFEEPTVAGQAERAAAARAQAEGVQLPPVLPVSRDGKLPLSFTQERMWFLQQMSPTMSAYNAPGAVLLEGEVDPVAMERAVRELLQRHEVFRTSYPAVNGEPSQRIALEVPFDLPVLDFRALPAAERRRRSLELVAREARRPFDLSRGPLLRVYLMHLGEREHMLGVVTHHVVYDMWAREVFIRELGIIYAAFAAGRPSPLPELPVQYADFAVWQRTWMQGDGLEGQLSYWREKLADAPPASELPGDRPRPPVQTFVGARTYLTVPPELASDVQTLARREGLTVFMVLLAGFKTVLARTLGQDRIVVGMPIANRNRVEVEGLIGFFANTLVLYTDLGGNPSFREALGRVRETALGSYTHQDMPFEYLVQEVRPPRDMSRTPLFQLMFNYLQNYALQPMQVPGLKLTAQEVHNSGAPFDLDLNMWATPEGFRGAADYNTDLFDRTTVIRLLRRFETLLAGAAAEPDRPLSELPLLPANESHQVLCEWNDAASEVPVGVGFQPLFEAQVDRTPQAVAAVCQGVELTYAELDRRADAVAAGLAARGVEPGVVVALLAERGLDFLAAVLGVFKAGGAYLPLDPRYPARRHVQVLRQSGAPLLVTTAELVPFVEEALSLMPDDQRPGALLALEELLAGGSAGRPPVRATGRDLAYVIYTSGSTGVPKGVMIEHGGMINHLWAKIQGLPLGPSDRIAQTASQTFDISVWQLLAALVLGGRVEIFPDDVAQDPQRLLEGVERGRITILETVPSLLRVLVEEAERGATVKNLRPGLAALRWMIPTGEALPPELTAAWLRIYPEIPLLNAYGPTECSDDVTHAVVRDWPESDAPLRVPIGRAVANTRLQVVDRMLQPLPMGVPGELCVGGAGVGRGYLGEPARTAEVFVPDPFTAEPGARLYLTGDLVRQLTDGSFDFLGRIDHQVKVRGFRIELGEIEAVLAEHPEVRQAVVVTREVEGAKGDPRLVAYVVPAGDVAPSSEELRALVGDRLPDYMIPAAVVSLESLPLTPNGKIDRKALPAPDAEQLAVQVEYVAPRNEVEESLARIWIDLLGVQRVGVYDDFFHLGGHSLLAARVVSRVREAFRVELPLATFFEESTLGNLADAIGVAQWAAAGSAQGEEVLEYEEMEVGEL
jgi:amino acid adenylation domain-containing protein